MATLDLTDIPMRPPPLHKSRFLRLPREVRDIIYAYTLIQPDYADRQHTAFCEHREKGYYVRPVARTLWIGSSRCPNGCFRRRGLNLLRACRRIHDEAAPIFWGKNVHLFQDAATFSRNIRQLRDQCRAYLRHVHITAPVWLDDHCPVYETDAVIQAMWTNIRACENLQTLELEPQLLRGYTITYRELCAGLPRLESMSLARVLGYNCRIKGDDGEPVTYRYIWIKIAKKIPPDQQLRYMWEVVRDYSTNHFVHVNFELNKELLHKPQPAVWHDRPPIYLAPHLNDSNSIQRLTLRDKTVTDIPFYGLPISKATRVKHFRERLFEQNRRKAAGLPRLEVEEAAEEVEKARKEKKKQEEIVEERERGREREEKKLAQERAREEERLAESRTRRNQRARQERKARKAEKIRQEERKRVPKKS